MRQRAFVCVGGEVEQGQKIEFRVKESICMCEKEGGGNKGSVYVFKKRDL